MSFAARHSKGSVFQCDTDGFTYKSLKELFGMFGDKMVYPIQGLYINRKSDYGDAPVAICEEYFVNFPQHMLDDVLDIMKTEEDIEDIKAGKVGFMIYQYEKEIGKNKKTCYGVKWCDI